MNIGFIGLGHMGCPVARNLIRLGYPVKLFDLSRPCIEKAMEAGTTGIPVEDPKKQMQDCDLIFTCLPMPAHVTGLMMASSAI